MRHTVHKHNSGFFPFDYPHLSICFMNAKWYTLLQIEIDEIAHYLQGFIFPNFR